MNYSLDARRFCFEQNYSGRGWGPCRVVEAACLEIIELLLPRSLLKNNIVGNLRQRAVACSASNHQGLNFESCVWRAESFHSSHHPQEVLLAHFNLHKDGLKSHSFILDVLCSEPVVFSDFFLIVMHMSKQVSMKPLVLQTCILLPYA